jgi:predicted nucleic acid-binding protein
MIISETSLLDSNVLVYAADETLPQHEPARNFREKGLRGEVPLCVCP